MRQDDGGHRVSSIFWGTTRKSPARLRKLLVLRLVRRKSCASCTTAHRLSETLAMNANERRKRKKKKNSRKAKTSWTYCGMDMATAMRSPSFLSLWPAARDSLHLWLSPPAVNQGCLIKRCCLLASLIPRLP